MKGLTRQVKKAAKQKVAAENMERWNSLTTAQKIADLDRRLGKGQGAVKQRARLAKVLEAEKAEAAPKKKAKK